MVQKQIQTQDTTEMVRDDDEDEQTLDETQIHDILSNRRRKLTLLYLARNGGSMTIRELSETIAADFAGQSPPPRDLRSSVYSSLHQTHLPKLDKLQVIDYDTNTKIAELNDRFDDVKAHMNAGTASGSTWAHVYFFLGLGSLLVVLGAEIGVPVIGSVGTLPWIVLTLGLLIATMLYRVLRTQGIPGFSPDRLR